MKISSRVLNIINFLKENNSTTIKEIALNLNLTERTVRYDIENINFILKNFNHNQIRKESKGKVEFEYTKKLENILLNLQEIKSRSWKERHDFLYFLILFKESINLSQLTKKMEVSRTTVFKDLKVVYSELEKKGFEIHNNTIINTNETFIRKEIINMFYSYILDIHKKSSKTLLGNYLNSLTKDSNVSSILKFMDNLITDKKYNKFYDLVYAYILISCIRIKNNKFVMSENDFFLKLTPEYIYIKNNISILEKGFNIKFSNDEITNITDVLLGIFSNLYNTSVYTNILNLKILLKQIVDNISEKLNVDFSQDELLMDRLYAHIKSCIYRIKNNLDIPTEIYLEEINDYPEILKIVKFEIYKLENDLQIKFSETEISFITMHFISSIERNTEKKAVKIVLVCNSGYGTSILLKDKIEKNYTVEVIDNISYLQLTNFDINKVDLIISSIPLKNNIYEKPIIHLNTFFKKDSEKILNSYGITKKTSGIIDNNKIYNLLQIIESNTTIHDKEKLLKEISQIFNVTNIYNRNKTLFDYITEKNINYIDNIKDWKEALNFVGKNLLNEKRITKKYMEEIFNTVMTFGAYFVIRNNIAIPHGQIDNNVLDNGISVLYIKNGIEFPNNQKVKLVILVASNNRNILMNTIKKINDISLDVKLYEKLNNFNKNEIINFLKGEKA